VQTEKVKNQKEYRSYYVKGSNPNHRFASSPFSQEPSGQNSAAGPDTGAVYSRDESDFGNLKSKVNHEWFENDQHPKYSGVEEHQKNESSPDPFLREKSKQVDPFHFRTGFGGRFVFFSNEGE
jgi:hypothetical protein